jgi:hypothetical protein
MNDPQLLTVPLHGPTASDIADLTSVLIDIIQRADTQSCT